MNDPLLLLCYMSILFAANVLGAVGGFGAGMISIPFLTSCLMQRQSSWLPP